MKSDTDIEVVDFFFVADEEKKIVQHQDQKFPQSPDEDLTREGSE